MLTLFLLVPVWKGYTGALVTRILFCTHFLKSLIHMIGEEFPDLELESMPLSAMWSLWIQGPTGGGGGGTFSFFFFFPARKELKT